MDTINAAASVDAISNRIWNLCNKKNKKNIFTVFQKEGEINIGNITKGMKSKDGLQGLLSTLMNNRKIESVVNTLRSVFNNDTEFNEHAEKLFSHLQEDKPSNALAESNSTSNNENSFNQQPIFISEGFILHPDKEVPCDSEPSFYKTQHEWEGSNPVNSITVTAIVGPAGGTIGMGKDHRGNQYSYFKSGNNIENQKKQLEEKSIAILGELANKITGDGNQVYKICLSVNYPEDTDRHVKIDNHFLFFNQNTYTTCSNSELVSGEPNVLPECLNSKDELRSITINCTKNGLNSLLGCSKPLEELMKGDLMIEGEPELFKKIASAYSEMLLK
ncbi:hypothetical protein [Endozoicomonas ascidiicola]|uniref:hypothetical protein n=1 Tax=Endozoicomonas ascidiicola TaxID=1698521 RepID=UPI00083601CD|nr:hypothetical protein [Endozoicomonas ascidiicola]